MPPVAADSPRRERLSFAATPIQLMLAAALFFALLANQAFFAAALQGRSAAEPQTWGFALALGVMLFSLHLLIIAPFGWQYTVKPLLAALVLVSAVSNYFMQAFGVLLDPSMIRNVLRTDVAEARELLSLNLLAYMLLHAGLPLALLWRARVVRRRWLRSVVLRIGLMLLAAALFVGALLAVFQPFASLMRNQHEMRYRITPGNVLWSAGTVLAEQMHGAARPRQAIGLDARPGPRMAARAAAGGRPLLVVLVVGETARAANWGLSGYARQTTPQLARLPVINFREVTSCGTNTEVSVPCLFAPVGRRDYDESTIRGSESLLHVLARAGVAVHWRDNQSGCKRVCDGLPYDQVADVAAPGLCDQGRCSDEGLLIGLPERLAAAAAAPGTQLLVLHQLGNHGPSYFRRYPPALAQFRPACEKDDLRLCSRDEIVNAYDNALLYTDEVLARLIARLQAAADKVDSVLLYVSDHGESLGENNLYLHGLPYAIAPDTQTRVPMLMWLSAGAPAATGIDADCLLRRATQPAAHDHVFHTLLALLDVKTALYAPAWDLAQGCRVP